LPRTVLGEVEPIGGAADLPTVELELNKRFLVIELDQLIAVKRYIGRPKDQLVEAELSALTRRDPS
jgi:hypothetical protein